MNVGEGKGRVPEGPSISGLNSMWFPHRRWSNVGILNPPFRKMLGVRVGGKLTEMRGTR